MHKTNITTLTTKLTTINTANTVVSSRIQEKAKKRLCFFAGYRKIQKDINCGELGSQQ